MNASTVVVLDASMLVAAAGSPDGGSAVVLRGLGGSSRHSWGAVRGLRFLTPGEFLAEERIRDESGA